MEIEDELRIKKATRQGQGNPRQMCVEFDNVEDKFKVLAQTSKLKGKKNVRRQLFFIDNNMG